MSNETNDGDVTSAVPPAVSGGRTARALPEEVVLANLLADTSAVPAHELMTVVDMAGAALGATSARMLVVDYGLTSLQELGENGPLGPRQPIAGTMPGRCFASSEIVVSTEHDPPTVWIPLTEGSERLGVLELTHRAWSEEHRGMAAAVVRVLVLVLVSKRRYSDIVLRSRRSEPLSLAAEIQWALLPPLTCSTQHLSLSGILEPAYSIGGDSFDYALNSTGVEFAIIDAVGHDLSAVFISSLALNSLRNARREAHSVERAYLDTDAALRAQFSRSAYITGQFGYSTTTRVSSPGSMPATRSRCSYATTRSSASWRVDRRCRWVSAVSADPSAKSPSHISNQGTASCSTPTVSPRPAHPKASSSAWTGWPTCSYGQRPTGPPPRRRSDGSPRPSSISTVPCSATTPPSCCSSITDQRVPPPIVIATPTAPGFADRTHHGLAGGADARRPPSNTRCRNDRPRRLQLPNCPRTTLYEASERDLGTVLVSDAVSGVYDVGLREMANIGTRVMDAREVTESLS
jgi:hypothetical protein